MPHPALAGTSGIDGVHAAISRSSSSRNSGGGQKRAHGVSLGPGDDLESAVRVLGDRRAALDPVAAIDVADAELVVDLGVVDVAADDAVDAAAVRLGGQRLLEVADVVAPRS